MRRLSAFLLFILIALSLDIDIVQPVDVSHDGRTISTCPMQEVVLILSDREDVTDPMYLFSYSGFIFDVEEREMNIFGDTLRFAPVALPWSFFSGSDTITYHVMMYFPDSARWFSDTVYTNSFISDTEAPEITETFPPAGVIHFLPEVASFAAMDNHCTTVHPSVSVQINSEAPDTVFGFSTSLSSLEFGDTLRICASVSDDCADYCDPNMLDSCWTVILVDSIGYEDSIEFVMELEPGWNLVSWPLTEARSTAGIEDIIPPVYSYSSESYIVVDTLKPTIGYWFLSAADTSLAFMGSELVSTSVLHFSPGWNLIGTHAMPGSELLAYPFLLPPIYGYDTESGIYLEADSLLQGKGYLILSTEADSVFIGE